MHLTSACLKSSGSGIKGGRSSTQNANSLSDQRVVWNVRLPCVCMNRCGQSLELLRKVRSARSLNTVREDHLARMLV